MTSLLVDGPNLAMRALYAKSAHMASGGVNTAPLVIFINTLVKHVLEEKPSRVVVCWDESEGGFRKELYPEYKANRAEKDDDFDSRKQTVFSLIKRFLSLANVHQTWRHGYEADDLIAWYVHEMADDESAVIISSDKDLLQMVSPRVEQVRLSSGGAPTDRWDVDRVREVYGCEPAQLPLAMALAGDASDNIPGVPGYGMKTAVKRLRKAGWDYREIEDAKVASRWPEVDVSYRLVQLLEPAEGLALPPLPTFDPTGPGDALMDHLCEFLISLEMSTLVQRLQTRRLWA